MFGSRHRRCHRFAAAATVALVALPVTALAGQPKRHHVSTHAKTPISVHSSPATISVRQGHSATSRIRVTFKKGAPKAAALRATGLPAGVRATFKPATVRRHHSATMTLTASAAIRPGSYSVRISATGVSGRLRRTRREVTARGRVAGRVAVRVLAATPTTTTPIPSHIPTWAYDNECGQGKDAPAALVQHWVTYAESNCGANAKKAVSDCHVGGVSYCTAVQYMDANWIYAQGSLPVAASAQENWWLHEPGYSDSAHRLADSAYGGGNILNQLNTSVDAWFKNYASTNYNSYDALMMDDTSGSLSNLTWGTGFSSSQEITSDAQLQAAHDQMAAGLTHSNGQPFLQIDNGLSVNDNLATPFKMLNDSTGVQGLISEGAPMSNGTMVTYYSTMLDEMAAINQTSHDFAVWLSYDPSGSLQARRVQAASILLGYSPGHEVSWSDLETNSSDLAIWPEEGIVPTNPIQTMGPPSGTNCLNAQGILCTTGGHNDIQVAPGVYRREFANCYDQSTPFGPCAAIVNTTNTPITIKSTWLTQTYTHQITLNGGDIQTGGTINTTTATYTPNTTTIPTNDATILTN